MGDVPRIVCCILVLVLVFSGPALASDRPGEVSYSVVHLSDTQVLSARYPATLDLTFSSLESLKETYNISAIIVTGDLVDSGSNVTQWRDYADARALTTIPLYEVAGNHDVRGTAYDYSKFDAWIGTGKRNWTAEIDDLLFIGIGYTQNSLGDTDVDAYNDLIQSHPAKIPVFATHDYFEGTTQPYLMSPLGESIRTNLVVRDPTIILCGHMHASILQSRFFGQETLTEDMTNYQTYGDYSAGNLYTVYQDSRAITRITVRHFTLYPTRSFGQEITVFSGSGVLPLPGSSSPPTDPDLDGRFEDLDGNGYRDFEDALLFFSYMDWIRENEPVAAFDFNGNGEYEADDIVRLYRSG